MSEPILGPTTIPHFVVKQLSPGRHGLAEADLVTALQEIETQTQIYGASFLKIHFDDPESEIVTSGLVAVDEDGLLNELEVEFPEGSGNFWQLAALEYGTEISAPNLVMTFEDRIVARLRQQWKHRTIPPGLTTRAQFAKALVDEANLKEHLNPPIKFVSPGLNRVEPVAEATQTKTSIATQAQSTAENRGRGIHAGAGFKIKGVAPSPEQTALLNEVVGIADELNTPTLAAEALIEAVITENDVSNAGEGILQVIPSTAAALGISETNVKQCVTAFLTKGFAGNGGAIEYAKKNPNAPAYEVAQAIQGSGAGAASKGAANYGPFHAEAQAILAAYGGMRAGGTTPTTSNESDVGQLSRGTPQNPDEDSWDCITRLAQEVGWFVFTDGHHTMFYMDGPDLIRQKPKLYIDVPRNLVVREDPHGRKVEEYGALIRPLSASYDNTAFLYRATHKVKQRLQRRSRISKPQTPAEVRMLMLCGIDEFRAGDVFVFRNYGPISENGGRWIVADATRETMKYPYTKFILVPPTEPLPEPKATATTTARENARSAAGQAQKALGEKSKYRYVYGGGRGPGVTLFGPEPREFDCASFVTLSYKEAGLPDPSGQNYNPIGTTQTMIENMKKTSNPQPGDLAFFGTLTHTTHVNIVVGGGRSISMGGEGDPSEGPTAQMGPAGFLGIWTPK
jgi:cell wall-associated NlpC family hydrolase